MTLETTLDITLITYNRVKYLKKTFHQVLSESSPIRNCSITVLDNRSTDGSSELIDEICRAHTNVTHVINNFNVGGNANIAKALERYHLPYHWILCDDDKYNWDGWADVEAAMERGERLICVGDRHLPDSGEKRTDIAEVLQQMTFLPSIIYGPGTISDTVIRNAYENTFALFPHLSPVIGHINHGGNIHVIRHGIVTPGEYGNDISYTRGHCHPIGRCA